MTDPTPDPSDGIGLTVAVVATIVGGLTVLVTGLVAGDSTVATVVVSVGLVLCLTATVIAGVLAHREARASGVGFFRSLWRGVRTAVRWAFLWF